MLAAVAGPAEPGDLPGQDAALAAFTRIASPPGTSPAALRSARRSLSERPARGRLPLAVALAAAAAGLGSTAAAYAGVLPSPIQHFAHVAFGAPAPPRDFTLHSPAVTGSHAHGQPEPSPSAPAKGQSAATSDPVSDKTHPGQLRSHLPNGNGPVPGYCWRVADIAATVHGLTGRGVVFLRYEGMDQDENGVWTTRGGDKIAWFTDPDGNVLLLTQFAF